jgi:hypothetical protein
LNGGTVLNQVPCRFSRIGGTSCYFHMEVISHENVLEPAIRFHDRNGDCASSQRAFQVA